MLELRNFYPVAELVTAIKPDIGLGDEFCVYTRVDEDLSLDSESTYWIDEYPDVDDDDDKEIFPTYVVENNLSYCYSGQQFADVIYVAQKMKPDATVEEYIRALNYYSQHDTFIELN